MNIRQKTFLILTATVLIIYTGFTGCQDSATKSGLFDLASFRAVDSEWEVKSTPEDSAGGAIMLSNDKWLMYFLHMRPLTDSNRVINVEYVRNRLLNFWGPSMPFTLTGVDGEMDIAGHRAYFVEATLNSGNVKTKFIVWNCKETNRQIIADCNINLLMKTPQEYFDIQEEITRTICCHNQQLNTENPDLPWSYQNDSLNIAFAKPVNWFTNTFPAGPWFPDGQKPNNATLWTLISDSEKLAVVKTCPGDLQLNKSTIDSLIQALPDQFQMTPTDSAAIEISLDSIQSGGDYIEGIGHYIVTQMYNGQAYPDNYKFRSLFWKESGNSYLLFVSMIAYTEVMNRPFDLVPSDSMMSHLLRMEVGQYVNPLPEKIRKAN